MDASHAESEMPFDADEERLRFEDDHFSTWRARMTMHLDGQLATHKKRPPILYHYTSTSTFNELVSKGELHASHVNYMADASEVRYGRDLFKEVVWDATSDWPEPARKEFIESTLYGARAAEGMMPSVYAVCLSAEGDDVGQWERYADGGRGYSIGFDSEELVTFLSRGEPVETAGWVDTAEVVYDATRQRELLQSLVSLALELYEDGAKERGDDPRLVQLLGAAMSVPALRLLVSYKQPGYASEKEWRLVYNRKGHEPHMNCDFKPRPWGMLPYVPLRLRPSTPGTPLPLREVISGPRQDRQSAPIATMNYLASGTGNSPRPRYPVIAGTFVDQLAGRYSELTAGKVVVRASRLSLRT